LRSPQTKKNRTLRKRIKSFCR